MKSRGKSNVKAIKTREGIRALEIKIPQDYKSVQTHTHKHTRVRV